MGPKLRLSRLSTTFPSGCPSSRHGRANEKSADVKGMELSVNSKAEMKSVDQSSSSAPKPKREHKKSKSTDVEKIVEINSVGDGVLIPSAEKLDTLKKTSQEVMKEIEV